MLFCMLNLIVCINPLVVEVLSDFKTIECSDPNPYNTRQNNDTSNYKVANRSSSEIIGRSEIDLMISEDKESSVGNFVTDAMVYSFRTLAKMAILQTEVAALLNIQKGNITIETIRDIAGINFHLRRIRGRELLQILEKSAAKFESNSSDTTSNFFHVSGMKIIFDLTKDVGQRVTSILVNDEDESNFDETRVYTIVIATNISNNNNNNAAAAIHDFLQYLPDKTIRADQYEETQCRVWMITKDYKNHENLIYILIAVITLSGVLTIVSNSTVLYVGINTGTKVFEKSILSLAVVDLLTGMICTPLVSIIYYYSRYHS